MSTTLNGLKKIPIMQQKFQSFMVSGLMHLIALDL